MPVVVSMPGGVGIGLSVLGAAKVELLKACDHEMPEIEKAPEPLWVRGPLLRVFRVVSRPPHRAQ
jgi:hypothetical protein